MNDSDETVKIEPARKGIGLTSEQIEVELRRRELAAEVRGSIFKAIRTLVVFAAAAVLLVTLLFPTVQVQRGSMSPTLRDGEQIVLFALGSVRRGDIIAFHLGNQTLLKRVIATAGEFVDIDRDGSVYVDGTLLDEPYLENTSFGDCDLEFPIQVPDKQFFVMGDNRAASMDSRLLDFGTVHGDGIIGKTIIRIWPLDRVGLVK
ncbi:MAG: signal peptidase I [Oscillospiraceae bacterium]|nr:signal peptidase I [Oscillospiraceae bacterium]